MTSALSSMHGLSRHIVKRLNPGHHPSNGQ